MSSANFTSSPWTGGNPLGRPHSATQSWRTSATELSSLATKLAKFGGKWVSAPDRQGVWRRMARFGGWEAQWLASVIMLQGHGKETEHGMEYRRDCDTMIHKEALNTFGQVSTRWQDYTKATIYLMGLVDIDEEFLKALLPDPAHIHLLMAGDKEAFFRAIEA